MPNARQISVIGSPARSCATNRRRSSTTEHSFHGIHTSRLKKAKSVTHVSGTNYHLCLRPHTAPHQPFFAALSDPQSYGDSYGDRNETSHKAPERPQG